MIFPPGPNSTLTSGVKLAPFLSFCIPWPWLFKVTTAPGSLVIGNYLDAMGASKCILHIVGTLSWGHRTENSPPKTWVGFMHWDRVRVGGKTTSLASVLYRVRGPVCLPARSALPADDVLWKPELRGEWEGTIGRRCLWPTHTFFFWRNTGAVSLARTVLITALGLVWAEDSWGLNGCHKRAVGVWHEY